MILLSVLLCGSVMLETIYSCVEQQWRRQYLTDPMKVMINYTTKLTRLSFNVGICALRHAFWVQNSLTY